MFDVRHTIKSGSLIIRALTPFCPQLQSCSRSPIRRPWKKWSRRYRGSALASNMGYRRLGKRNRLEKRGRKRFGHFMGIQRTRSLLRETCSTHSPVSLSSSIRWYSQGRIWNASFFYKHLSLPMTNMRRIWKYILISRMNRR